MSVVCRMTWEVSETRRSFKPTCFGDKWPWFSNEANPQLENCWI